MQLRPTIPSMLRLRHPLRLLVPLTLALAFTACFEPPVLETLDLRFLRDGSFIVTSTVELSDGNRESNPAGPSLAMMAPTMGIRILVVALRIELRFAG